MDLTTPDHGGERCVAIARHLAWIGDRWTLPVVVSGCWVWPSILPSKNGAAIGATPLTADAISGCRPRNDHAFEFKQLNCERYTPGALAAAMEAARACARCVRESESDLRVAGLVASMWWHDAVALEGAGPAMRAFARDRDFAWRIGAEGFEKIETSVFFDIVHS